MRELNFYDNYFPNKLMNISQKPKKLFIEGNIDLLNSIGIAVIGSRHPSDYGKRMCKYFTKELVQYGVTIISGMANGIDTIAHKTCLENGGKTIAVLPCGFDNIFPKNNKELYRDILNLGGTAVSEYSIKEKAEYKKFLERNRIVAGLGIGTLVIEAGYRSGTSVTARITEKQGKKVFCVPSSLDNEKGITSNRIIQNGGKLVTCAEDILKEFENINFVRKIVESTTTLIDDEYLDVYNILSYKPQYINDIAKKLEKSINDVSYILMMLEIEGHAIQLPGKNFIRK